MFGLVKQSTLDNLYSHHEALGYAYDNIKLKLETSEAENLTLRAKIKGYEKTYNIRTDYYKDAGGRWRDPKTGYSVATSVVMTAQLKKEQAKRAKVDGVNAYGVKQSHGVCAPGAAYHPLNKPV